MSQPTTDYDDLREQLAAIEHERWSDWQRWMHRQHNMASGDGALIIPARLVAHWERQIATPYAKLSEAEKRSDREQVDRYWPLLEAAVAAAEARGYRKAITALRDWDRYAAWQGERERGIWVTVDARRHLSYYLEAIAEEGK